MTAPIKEVHFCEAFKIAQAHRVRNSKSHNAAMEAILASYGCSVNINSDIADMLIARGTSREEYFCHKCHKIKNRSEFAIYEYISKARKFSLTRKKCNDCMKATKRFDRLKTALKEAC